MGSTIEAEGGASLIVPIGPNSRRLQPMLAGVGVQTHLVVVDAGHELFNGAAKERADRAIGSRSTCC